MSVQGNTSAIIATVTYVPPFKYVTSYAPAPLVTGTVTSAPTGTADPIATGTSAADYATNYLQVHMMSSTSYRYAYLLWMVLALLAILYGLSHHIRLTKGSVGASYARWGMKRTTLGSKKPGARSRTLSSNGVIVSILVIFIASAALCVIGPDYITPQTSVLNFANTKRDASGPTYTIAKAFWTSGSRFGIIAFALTPLVVLLALKSPPVAILAWRPLTHLYSDKLATFHKAVAWIIWILTTIHVALWTVQLFYDKRNGQAVWFVIWLSYRFCFGVAAYVALTAVMVLSLKPVRKARYEFFYIAHVVTVFLTIVCAAIHHPPLWYWMAISLALWVLERLHRVIRTARINHHRALGKPYTTEEYGMTPIKPAYDKTLPKAPVEPEVEFGGKLTASYYDEGSLQPLGSYDTRYSSDATYGGTRKGYFPTATNDYPESTTTLHPARNSIATLPVDVPIPAPPTIPIGYAQAQLLPSRTVRLTIKVARPFKWAPGQSVLLYLPELSKLQSHPFTILNNDTHEIILLVKARKGLTRKLYDLVRERSLANVGLTPGKNRLSLASMRASGKGDGVKVPPIYVKTKVDGPFGSSGRVRWGEHSTVVIICGGSGVSFGVGICEHICGMMARKETRTERVRFCWVAREYAEIAWVASQLRRCQDMVSALQLQIDIFVTNANKTTFGDEFLPPRPGFAADSRRGSIDSNASETSRDGYEFATLETETGSYEDVVDLTNYEDEEDVNDPAEHQLSEQLQQQGKLRRAKSRKAAKQKTTRRSAYEAYDRRSAYDDDDDVSKSPPGLLTTRSPSNPMLSANPDRRQSYRSLAESTYGRYDPFASGGGGGGPRGPSPSPSILFDDAQSIGGESMRNLLSRQSRTQSMVLLEDIGRDGDDALWIDEADFAAMGILSEMARAGKPKLATVLQEEIEIAKGSLIVATCGPVTLNTVVRSLVSRHISPSRIRHGDRRGHIAIYSEDYES